MLGAPELPPTPVELLASARRSRGSAEAVVGREGSFSWSVLARRVEGRADRWRGLGVRRGDRVALLADNTIPFLEAYFAAALAGAVLVPLNHRLAPPELDGILADAEPRILLWEPRFGEGVEALTRAPGVTLPVEVDPPAPRGRPRDPALTAEDLALLYYTSGTTGRPKGVMLSCGNVGAHAVSAVEELRLTASERWGHFAPLFHLADAWAVFAITLAGGTHVLPGRYAPEVAFEWIERGRVTQTNLVPTMIADLLDSPCRATADTKSLRRVLSGGAPIAPTLVERILAELAPDYVQTYGLTETSPFLTLGLLDRLPPDRTPEERLRTRCRSGRPFGGVEVRVVDEKGREVPRDDSTVGEVLARGPTVTPGYWRNPEETARAFRDGWFRTGDLAVVDADGYLNLVDRRKDVILTGGETVYSTEVEAALLAHPSVLEAAVVARPDPRWGERVHACLALRPGASTSPAALSAFLRPRLAGYKIPRSFEFLERLPRTGSGKIAKALLRAGGDPEP